MMYRDIRVVQFRDVMDHIGFGYVEMEDILDYRISRDVTWGDAAYTLIHRDDALHFIIDGLDCIEIDDYAPSRSIITEDDVRRKFDEVVGKDDYINLEEH